MRYTLLVYGSALLLALSACGKEDAATVKVGGTDQTTEKITLTFAAGNTAHLKYEGGNPEYATDQNGTWESVGNVYQFRFFDGSTAACSLTWDCNFSTFGSRQF